jgi:dTDP-4-dehydrorhamnose reductase
MEAALAGGIEGVLVLGCSGMLGHRMLEVLSRSFRTCGTLREPEGAALSPAGFFGEFPEGTLIRGVDARRIETVERCVESVAPSVVVNCIGVIRQLPEGSDPVASIELNSLFPHRLAAICRRRGAWLIHVGTDCVFSGAEGGYAEDDPVDAQDLYGRSKALGEPTTDGCLTLRTSIIGRELGRSTGLLEWFLSRRGGTADGYTRAIWSGLTTEAFASTVAELAVRRPGLEGLYHVSSGPISKYDLLELVNRTLGLGIRVVPAPVPVEDRSLCGERFVSETGIRIPSMEQMISSLMGDLERYDEWRGRHERA